MAAHGATARVRKRKPATNQDSTLLTSGSTDGGSFTLRPARLFQNNAGERFGTLGEAQQSTQAAFALQRDNVAQAKTAGEKFRSDAAARGAARDDNLATLSQGLHAGVAASGAAQLAARDTRNAAAQQAQDQRNAVSAAKDQVSRPATPPTGFAPLTGRAGGRKSIGSRGKAVFGRISGVGRNSFKKSGRRAGGFGGGADDVNLLDGERRKRRKALLGR